MTVAKGKVFKVCDSIFALHWHIGVWTHHWRPEYFSQNMNCFSSMTHLWKKHYFQVIDQIEVFGWVLPPGLAQKKYSLKVIIPLQVLAESARKFTLSHHREKTWGKIHNYTEFLAKYKYILFSYIIQWWLYFINKMRSCDGSELLLQDALLLFFSSSPEMNLIHTASKLCCWLKTPFSGQDCHYLQCKFNKLVERFHFNPAGPLRY